MWSVGRVSADQGHLGVDHTVQFCNGSVVFLGKR